MDDHVRWVPVANGLWPGRRSRAARRRPRPRASGRGDRHTGHGAADQDEAGSAIASTRNDAAVQFRLSSPWTGTCWPTSTPSIGWNHHCITTRVAIPTRARVISSRASPALQFVAITASRVDDLHLGRSRLGSITTSSGICRLGTGQERRGFWEYRRPDGPAISRPPSRCGLVRCESEAADEPGTTADHQSRGDGACCEPLFMLRS